MEEEREMKKGTGRIEGTQLSDTPPHLEKMKYLSVDCVSEDEKESFVRLERGMKFHEKRTPHLFSRRRRRWRQTTLLLLLLLLLLSFDLL